MTSDSQESTNPLPNRDSIDFHWLKEDSYRTVHVDGAVGGVSPTGKMIHMALYSERWPIPTVTSHKLVNGALDPSEIPGTRIQRDGIIREISTNLVFDEVTARNLVSWLQQRLEQLEQMKATEYDSPPVESRQ